MNSEKENLRDLLRKFYNDSDAAEVEDDIARGDELFARNTTPGPEASTVSSIKLRVSSELAKRHRRGVGVYVGAGLTAAAAVILIAFGLFLIQNGQQPQPAGGLAVSEAAWEVGDFTVDDPGMAILAADVEALEEEVLAMQLGENSSEGTSVDELEIEWLEMNSDFWKG